MVTTANRIAVFAFIALASGFIDGSVRAQSQSRIALLVGKSAFDMAERVRGQTADLAWSVKTDARVELSDARGATAISEKFGADVVIWFDISSENRVVVNAVQASTGKKFQRPVELEGDETELSASATVEAAALVVRSLLIALDRSEDEEAVSQTATGSTPPNQSSSTNGLSSSQPSTDEPPLPDSSSDVSRSQERTRDTDSSASEVSVEDSASDAFEWQLAAGWHFVADGVSPAGQHGPHLRLGFNPGRVQLALSGYLAFAAEIESDELTIELRRYALLGSIGYEFFPGSEFRLSTSLGAGILLITRSTSVHVDELDPTPDAKVNSLLIAWDTRVQWFPVWVRKTVGLEFTADLAIIPGSVDFGIREGDEVVDRKESWVVQPSFCLSFVLRID